MNGFYELAVLEVKEVYTLSIPLNGFCYQGAPQADVEGVHRLSIPLNGFLPRAITTTTGNLPLILSIPLNGFPSWHMPSTLKPKPAFNSIEWILMPRGVARLGFMDFQFH